MDRSQGKDVISVKWIYKTKHGIDGNVLNHKDRLVVIGFTQHPTIYYNEKSTIVACLDTMRIILAIAAQNKWFVFQMDVKYAFLNGFLEEEVYVNIGAEGFYV